MSQWIRAFAQTTTYLGVAMIAAIWGGIYFLTGEAYDRAYDDGLRQGSNLARVFEEYISRAISGIDGELLVFRKLYNQDTEHFDFHAWIDSAARQNKLTVHFSITGPDGIIRLSSLGPVSSVVDISDREPFRVHAGSSADALYISKPAVGLLSGKPSIQLTRRLLTLDGSFAGIISASLDIVELERFYNSVDIGRDGIIALIGFDGILRARSGRDTGAREYVGQSVSGRTMFGMFRETPGRKLLELAQHRHLRARQAADLLPGGGRITIARHRRIGRGRHLSAGRLDGAQVRSDRPAPDRHRAVRDRHRDAAPAQACGRQHRARAIEALAGADQRAVRHGASEHGARPVHVRRRSTPGRLQRTLWRHVRATAGLDQTRHHAARHPAGAGGDGLLPAGSRALRGGTAGGGCQIAALLCGERAARRSDFRGQPSAHAAGRVGRGPPGHHGAKAGRDADRLPGAPRRPDRSIQPRGPAREDAET